MPPEESQQTKKTFGRMDRKNAELPELQRIFAKTAGLADRVKEALGEKSEVTPPHN
jgi:hypothetical protein